MATLSSLHSRIRRATAEKVLEKVLAGEARAHFKKGFWRDCSCSICVIRRNYAREQSQPNRSQFYVNCLGVKVDRREVRRDEQRKLISQIMKDI